MGYEEIVEHNLLCIFESSTDNYESRLDSFMMSIGVNNKCKAEVEQAITNAVNQYKQDIASKPQYKDEITQNISNSVSKGKAFLKLKEAVTTEGFRICANYGLVRELFKHKPTIQQPINTPPQGNTQGTMGPPQLRYIRGKKL